MADPLIIKRQNGSLSVSKTGSRWNVATTGGGNITREELDKIKAHIGDDPDGAAILEKLERRIG